MAIADRIRIALGKLTPEEIAERDTAARLRREAAERAAAEQVTAPQSQVAAQNKWTQAELDAQSLHEERLARAAAIGRLQLKCHSDTWDCVHRWMNDGRGFFEMPWHVGTGRVNRLKDDMVTVALSGPQVIEVLQRLAWIRGLPGIPQPYKVGTPRTVDRPLAVQLYDALAAVIDQVEPGKTTGEDLPPAVVDARVTNEESEN